MSFPNFSETLVRRRAQYPAKLSPEQAVALLNAVAFDHAAEGMGLLRKDGGNHGKQPVTGIFCSCDWLVHKPSGLGADVLGSGPDSTTDPVELGPSVPQWGHGEPIDLTRFVAPVAVGVVVDPPDDGKDNPPTDPPKSVDLSAILAKQDQQLAATKDVAAAVKAASDAQVAKLDELKVAIIKSVRDFTTAIVPILSGGGLDVIAKLLNRSKG